MYAHARCHCVYTHRRRLIRHVISRTHFIFQLGITRSCCRRYLLCIRFASALRFVCVCVFSSCQRQALFNGSYCLLLARLLAVVTAIVAPLFKIVELKPISFAPLKMWCSQQIFGNSSIVHLAIEFNTLRRPFHTLAELLFSTVSCMLNLFIHVNYEWIIYWALFDCERTMGTRDNEGVGAGKTQSWQWKLAKVLYILLAFTHSLEGSSHNFR